MVAYSELLPTKNDQAKAVIDIILSKRQKIGKVHPIAIVTIEKVVPKKYLKKKAEPFR